MQVNWKYDPPVLHWVQSKLLWIVCSLAHLQSTGGTGLWFGYVLAGWPAMDSHHRALTPLILIHKTSTTLSPTPQRRPKHLCCFRCKRKFHLLLFFYSCLSEKACILPSAYEALSSVCFLGCWHCVQAFWVLVLWSHSCFMSFTPIALAQGLTTCSLTYLQAVITISWHTEFKTFLTRLADAGRGALVLLC